MKRSRNRTRRTRGGGPGPRWRSAEGPWGRVTLTVEPWLLFSTILRLLYTRCFDDDTSHFPKRTRNVNSRSQQVVLRSKCSQCALQSGSRVSFSLPGLYASLSWSHTFTSLPLLWPLLGVRGTGTVKLLCGTQRDPLCCQPMKTFVNIIYSKWMPWSE